MRRALCLVLSCFGVCLLLATAAGARDFSKYPLRVHIFQHTAHSHYWHMALTYVDGEGRANLFENGQPEGFDFKYWCDDRIMNSMGFETYYARWKKPGQELEVLFPVMGKPGAAESCDLKVILKNAAYFYRNGVVAEEPQAAYKAWMDRHRYDPEHGLIEPVNLANTASAQTPINRPPDAARANPEPSEAMPADADPSLTEVIIAPNDPRRPGKLFDFRAGHFIAINTSVNDLIAFAYGIHATQIVGGPAWFGVDLCNIDGVSDVPGVPNDKQSEIMVQKLLTDRFLLVFHREQRILPVYLIKVAPRGPKLTQTKAPPVGSADFGFKGLGNLFVRNITMAEFAHGMLSVVMDKPVVDQTGLNGRYDFNLRWTPDASQFAQFRGTPGGPRFANFGPNPPPILYMALPQQLGLEMVPGEAQLDVIVIENAVEPF